MSGVSLPVNRPIGRALVVAGPANRADSLQILQELGYGTAETDDPYGAMVELCRRPLVYRAVILSLASLYREELNLIQAVKRRFPHLEIWLTHSDGRQAALAEAMRLGADGLLAHDGLHRTGLGMGGLQLAADDEAQPSTAGQDGAATASSQTGESSSPYNNGDSQPLGGEPVLTADELRALLQDQVLPPAGLESQ